MFVRRSQVKHLIFELVQKIFGEGNFKYGWHWVDYLAMDDGDIHSVWANSSLGIYAWPIIDLLGTEEELDLVLRPGIHRGTVFSICHGAQCNRHGCCITLWQVSLSRELLPFAERLNGQHGASLCMNPTSLDCYVWFVSKKCQLLWLDLPMSGRTMELKSGRRYSREL
jgi:hypothetical protein